MEVNNNNNLPKKKVKSLLFAIINAFFAFGTLGDMEKQITESLEGKDIPSVSQRNNLPARRVTSLFFVVITIIIALIVFGGEAGGWIAGMLLVVVLPYIIFSTGASFLFKTRVHQKNGMAIGIESPGVKVGINTTRKTLFTQKTMAVLIILWGTTLFASLLFFADYFLGILFGGLLFPGLYFLANDREKIKGYTLIIISITSIFISIVGFLAW